MLEISQFIVLCLAGLVTVEAQLLILMGEALEHPQVHELLIPNMDLQSTKPSEILGGGAACSRRDGRGWASLRMEQQTGSKKKHWLVLNQARIHDFAEIPPKLPMKMEKRDSFYLTDRERGWEVNIYSFLMHNFFSY